MKEQYDVAIIGGGVVGSAVARQLSRYKLKICVLEKELDVLCGVSGHNTGLLHSGILHKKGTLRMQCSLEGNAQFDQVAKELDVPFKRCGKLFVDFGENGRKRLEKLYNRGLDNQIPGLRIIGRDQINAMEPNAKGDWAVYVPSAGILCPFSYTIALAENAAKNGVRYFFDCEVTGIQPNDNGDFLITTKGGEFCSRWAINCAGLNACHISPILGFDRYTPNRVKGEYEILDKKFGAYLGMPIYPTPYDSGHIEVHVTPTVDGNVLVGPTIETIGDAVTYNVTQKKIDEIGVNGRKLFDYVRRENYIRSYAGVFPRIEDPMTGEELDFQIQTKSEIPHAVNLVAITSPGLTSALPIANRVVDIVKKHEALTENESFDPTRKAQPRFSEMDDESRRRLIQQDPEYGEIVCRCECVTKAEIRMAIRNILGVRTVAGIKYRTRATMGRCQGGYCQTRITAMLQEELGMNKSDILLNKNGAYMFTGDVK